MSRRTVSLCVLLIALSSCGRTHEHAAKDEGPESWPITAWGETFEIFAEIDPLVAGSLARSNTRGSWAIRR